MIWFLGSLLLTMSGIALAAAALSKRMSTTPPAARHSMWLGAMAAMIATPLTWLSLGGLWSIPVRHDSVFRYSGPIARFATLLISSIWMCGAALAATVVIAGAVRIRRGARVAPHHDAPSREAWEHAADAARRVIGVSTSVRLLESTTEATPITWGIRRPVILLPQSAREWSPARRWAVLLHELSHIRRRDYLVELFLLASTIAYWFHPAIWWMAQRVREEREAACDDMVLAAGMSPLDYAEHLVEIARGVVRERRIAIVGLDMTRASALVSRVGRILDRRTEPTHPQRPGVVLFSTFLVALSLGLAMPGARPILPHAAKAKCDCAAKRRARAAAAASESRSAPERRRVRSS